LVADVPARLLATVRSRCQPLTVVAPESVVARAWLSASGVGITDEAMALSAGHPGVAGAYADPARTRRMAAIADDLRQLADGRESVLAVAKRWSDDATGHVDDATAWLRVWSWAANDVDLVTSSAPDVAAIVLADT